MTGEVVEETVETEEADEETAETEETAEVEETEEAAYYMSQVILPAMDSLRSDADTLEQLTDKAYTLLPNERYIKAYWSEDLLKSMNCYAEMLPPFIELGKASGTLSEKAQNILEIDNIQLMNDEKTDDW